MRPLQEAFHIAVANLAANLIRSLLSILGIVIGIAAVIVVLSVGAGLKQHILAQINALGSNTYTVSGRYDEKTSRVGTVELEDVKRLQMLPSVASAMPMLTLYKTLRSRSVENRGIVNGADESYLTTKRLSLSKGRNFSPVESEGRLLVCLINEVAAATFFPGGETVIDRQIYVDGLPWEVIGVYVDNKRAGGEPEIIVPMGSLLRNMKDVIISGIEVQLRPDAGEAAKQEILDVMQRGDPRRQNLFGLRNQTELYARSLQIQGLLSMIGAIVAAISLIVGGVGMMNVMLTSVAERTREIGIRRAVGARKKDILYQFLVESCVLSGAGAALGLLAGAALAHGLPILMKEFFTVAPLIRPVFVLFAVGAGAILGITFGFYPAVKASNLSPSEALRTE